MPSLNPIVAAMVGTILVLLSSSTGGRALLHHGQAYGASNEADVPIAPIFGGRRALVQHGQAYDASNAADVPNAVIFSGGRALVQHRRVHDTSNEADVPKTPRILLQQGRVHGVSTQADVPNTPILAGGRALLQDSPPYVPDALISGGGRATPQHGASIYGRGRALLQYERKHDASNKETVPNAPNFAGERTLPDVAYVPPSAPSPCTYIPSIAKNDCNN